MDDPQLANVATKRRASSSIEVSEDEDYQRDRNKKPRAHDDVFSNLTEDEHRKIREEGDAVIAMLNNLPLPDECQEFTDEVESGSHKLILEHNNATNAKCRAFNCLVQGHRGQYGDKIRSPYRLNLQVTQWNNAHWSELEKPNRRFYHVSCLEAVGIDIAKYCTLPPERVVTPFGVSNQNFHPAIVDWVMNNGKAYDAQLYRDYKEAFGNYQKQLNVHSRIHSANYFKGNYVCPEPPRRPESSDFIPGEPSERSLTNVLLHVLGADHLLPLNQRNSVAVLEVHGRLPSKLSKAALASAKKENTDDKEVEAETPKSKADENVKIGEAQHYENV